MKSSFYMKCSNLIMESTAANVSKEFILNIYQQVTKVPYGLIDNTIISHIDNGDIIIDVSGWYYIRLNIAFKELTAEQNYHDYRICINGSALCAGINDNPRPSPDFMSQYSISDVVYMHTGDRVSICAYVDKSAVVLLTHTRFVLMRR